MYVEQVGHDKTSRYEGKMYTLKKKLLLNSLQIS